MHEAFPTEISSLCRVTILKHHQRLAESWLYLETVIKYSDFTDFFLMLKMASFKCLK